MNSPTEALPGLGSRVALVTGASRGLGRAIARKLCASGAHVLLNYVSDDAAAATALAELSGLAGTAELLKGDVRDPDGVVQLLDAVGAAHGGLDILVHNAATWRPMAAAAHDPAAFAAEQQLALGPLLNGAPQLAKLMAGRPGRIVAVSSNGAHSVIPGYVGVGVAKAALESLVRYLAVEFAPSGVTVNAVATAMLDKGPETLNQPIARFLAGRTPAGRLSTPADVADFVALLCTDEAAWVQGQVITVDGGLGLLA
jgi:enoyl-[acyl-carrier protein] reductase III